MIRFFAKAVCSAICFIPFLVGCQKEVMDNQSSEERTTLRISIPVDETKAVSGINETAVTTYQVFLFKEDGSIEDYTCQTSSDIVLDCTIGMKTIVALLNAPVMGDIMDYSTLLSRTSFLSDNALDAFVMEGKTTVNIQTSDVVSIKLPVSRKVAKVELSSLSVAIDMPQYSSKSFKVLSVFLINVPADMPYFNSATSSLWYNKMGYDSEDDNTLIYDNMNAFEVTEATPYTAKNTFYCYPNKVAKDSFSETWDPRNTRLVVEAMLGDEKFYYPVTLPALDSNRIYEVNLTITRPGAENPDAFIDKFTVPFIINIRDWEKVTSVTEEI